MELYPPPKGSANTFSHVTLNYRNRRKSAGGNDEPGPCPISICADFLLTMCGFDLNCSMRGRQPVKVSGVQQIL